MEVSGAIELDGQYRALREEAGLVERSERGKLLVRGPEGADYLQGQLTNDIVALAPGEGCYAALLDRKGRMQADMRVLRLGESELWLDAEPQATGSVIRHLSMYKVGREVEIEDVGSRFGIVSVIGPAARDVVSRAGGRPAGSLAGPSEHQHAELDLAGERCRAVANDGGVDLICGAEESEAVLASLLDAGAVSVSEDAAEVLRVESGRPRFGAEMTTATIPQEAGIVDRAVSFTKGCYIGQETVARLHYKGKPNRHLRGLRLEAPVSAGDPVRAGERALGEVGTAVISPRCGPIALAVLRREASPGDRIEVGERQVGGEVVDPPF